MGEHKRHKKAKVEIVVIMSKIKTYEDFVRERITELRLLKDVTESKMSCDLNKNRGYIQNISSGKSLPSLKELFSIAEYFEVTPEEFFNDKSNNSDLIMQINRGIDDLNREDLELLLSIIGRIGLLRSIVKDYSQNCKCNIQDKGNVRVVEFFGK